MLIKLLSKFDFSVPSRLPRNRQFFNIRLIRLGQKETIVVQLSQFCNDITGWLLVKKSGSWSLGKNFSNKN